MNSKNPALAFAIVVEILSPAVTEINGKKADGTEYALRKQEAYLHTGHGYPDRFDFILGKDEAGRPRPAKPAGFYALGAQSIRIDRQRLQFGFETVLERLPGVNSAADLVSLVRIDGDGNEAGPKRAAG
jgi:hypothetical protein